MRPSIVRYRLPAIAVLLVAAGLLAGVMAPRPDEPRAVEVRPTSLPERRQRDRVRQTLPATPEASSPSVAAVARPARPAGGRTTQTIADQVKRMWRDARHGNLLAARVSLSFGFDPLRCTACGGRMKPIAFLKDPAVVGAILSALDLPADPPAIAPASEQLELFEA